MKTLLVHDESPMSRLLIAHLADERVSLRSVAAASIDPADVYAWCAAVDAVIYVSTGWDAVAAERDSRWLDSLIATLQGSASRLLYVSEHPGQADAERRLREAAASGVRSVIVRPTLVHGQGTGQLLQRLVTYAESSGESVYVDDGASCTSTVHIDDVISLVRRALDSSQVGSTYVAASDEVVTWRDVAVAVASTTRGPCRLRSVTVAEAAAAGLDAATMAMSTVVRDHSAVRRLGWSAVGPELVTDL
jgi:hypothetical protein